MSDTNPLATLCSIREGARPERFVEVRERFMREVMEWSRTTSDFELVKNAKLPPEFPASVASRGAYELKAAYARYDMSKRLGIPPGSDQGEVILIPYLHSTVIRQYSGPLLQKDG